MLSRLILLILSAILQMDVDATFCKSPPALDGFSIDVITSSEQYIDAFSSADFDATCYCTTSKAQLVTENSFNSTVTCYPNGYDTNYTTRNVYNMILEKNNDGENINNTGAYIINGGSSKFFIGGQVFYFWHKIYNNNIKDVSYAFYSCESFGNSSEIGRYEIHIITSLQYQSLRYSDLAQIESLIEKYDLNFNNYTFKIEPHPQRCESIY